MSDRLRPIRRGAALLVVLATLVMTVIACATLARHASTLRTQREIDGRARTADDMLAAVDGPIRAWLRRDSEGMVLPADAAAPFVTVLNDEWPSETQTCAVEVTAWDQCGMPPATVARTASPLRRALPATVLAHLDRVRVPDGAPPGLDLYRVASRGADAPPVYPFSPPAPPARFEPVPETPADGDFLAPRDASGPAAGASGQGPWTPRAFGAYVATHNPGRINVHTAPLAVVEEALSDLGIDAIDLVREARDAGERVGLPGGGERRDGRRGGSRVEVVTESVAWAMRIDVRVGNARRSWWGVYVKSSNDEWECVQRLAITE